MTTPESESNLPQIEYGNTKGEHFTQWRFDKLAVLVFHFGAAGIEIEDMKLDYDADHDFHNLWFTLDGHRYVVQLYKIMTLWKDVEPLPKEEKSSIGGLKSPFERRGFGRTGEHHIVSFFNRGFHEDWEAHA